MGRLTLNILLSFAQFEREVIGERVRDKIAASKRKGIWVGGPVPRWRAGCPTPGLNRSDGSGWANTLGASPNGNQHDAGRRGRR